MGKSETEPDEDPTSAIRATEAALILSLPARRKTSGGGVAQNLFIIAFFSIVLWVHLTQSEYIDQNFVWLLGTLIALALYFQLYQLFGRDSLEFNENYVLVRVGIGPFKRRFKYHADRVSALRCTATVTQRRLKWGIGRGSSAWAAMLDPETEMIVCDYDGRETPLIGSLNPTLARHFVSQVKQRFPDYRFR